MTTWTPLLDIWKEYHEQITEAAQEGHLDKPDTATKFIWPEDLYIYDPEKDEINEFLVARVNEIIEHVNTNGGFNPSFIASYVFKSLMAGMLWERDRVGR